jgi:hypothetical protein
MVMYLSANYDPKKESTLSDSLLAEYYRPGTPLSLVATRPKNQFVRRQDHGTKGTKRWKPLDATYAYNHPVVLRERVHLALAYQDDGTAALTGDLDRGYDLLFVEDDFGNLVPAGSITTPYTGPSLDYDEEDHEEGDDLATMMEEVPGGIHFGVIGDFGCNPDRTFFRTPVLEPGDDEHDLLACQWDGWGYQVRSRP